MKKLSIAAFALVATITTTPLATEAANYKYIDSNSLQEVVGQNYSNIYDYLKQNCDNPDYYIMNGNITDCPQIQIQDNCPPEITPDVNTPDVETPPVIETPEEQKPAPETPQPEAPKESVKENSYETQVLKLVNAERKKAGLNELTLNQNAEKAALIRAKEIVSTFSHTRPNGTSFSTALTESGTKFKGAGENIAWGQTSPEKVMEAWMNSAGHRANILNKSYTSMGVGHHKSGSTNYWTQLFVY